MRNSTRIARRLSTARVPLGVTTMITVGCDVADSFRALELAREYRLYSSVGIHPHEAKDAPADIPAIFESFLRDPRVVAIGEAGLDYYYDHSPRDVQRRVLREQLELAREAGFPVHLSPARRVR